jgi:hypothetical protein
VVLVLDGLEGEDPGTEPDNVTVRKYTWGLDMSGLQGAAGFTPAGMDGSSGIHGAGGIGGLLAVEESAVTGSPAYWFLYDANGNVGQVIRASDQTLAAAPLARKRPRRRRARQALQHPHPTGSLPPSLRTSYS